MSLGHKWPLVFLLECVSKKYLVLLPLICSVPSIALCFVCQLRCCTSSSSQFLIFPLIILYTAFLNIPLPSVRPNFIHFFHRIWTVHYMSKIFQFARFKVYPRIIILYSVIPECHCQNIFGAKLTNNNAVLTWSFFYQTLHSWKL